MHLGVGWLSVGKLWRRIKLWSKGIADDDLLLRRRGTVYFFNIPNRQSLTKFITTALSSPWFGNANMQQSPTFASDIEKIHKLRRALQQSRQQPRTLRGANSTNTSKAPAKGENVEIRKVRKVWCVKDWTLWLWAVESWTGLLDWRIYVPPERWYSECVGHGTILISPIEVSLQERSQGELHWLHSTWLFLSNLVQQRYYPPCPC